MDDLGAVFVASAGLADLDAAGSPWTPWEGLDRPAADVHGGRADLEVRRPLPPTTISVICTGNERQC